MDEGNESDSALKMRNDLWDMKISMFPVQRYNSYPYHFYHCTQQQAFPWLKDVLSIPGLLLGSALRILRKVSSFIRQALAGLFPQIAYFGDCSEATALSFLVARQDYPEQIQRSLYFTNSSSFCRSQYASIFSNVELRDMEVEMRKWKLAAN